MDLGVYDLHGKVAFVTGGGTGIGRGIAEELAHGGADVAINALTDRYVVPLCERLSETSGQRATPIIGDLTTPAAADAAVAEVIGEFGRIDVLVNALGEAGRNFLVALPESDTPGMTDEELLEILNLNLLGTIYCSRAVGPHFLDRQSGKVINISGIASVRVSGPGSTMYTTSKTAISGFTRALAVEWAAHNIQVNTVSPGGDFPDPIRAADRFEERRASTAKRTPLGRAGDIAEIGYLVRFLASDAANFITGQTIHIDGGISLL
jgi:3-oxoacyl-[acyl-carrier protein] reductase